MGVEAFLTVAKIKNGLQFLDLSFDPVFKVTDPVAILPFHRCELSGGRWINFEYQDLSIHNLFINNELMEQVLIPLGDKIGVGIVPIKYIPDWMDKWAMDSPFSAPGYIPFSELEKTWAKIDSGFWAITKYIINGANGYEDWSWPAINRVPFEFEKEITWEFWT